MMSVVRKKEALTTVIPLIKAQAKNTALKPKRAMLIIAKTLRSQA